MRVATYFAIPALLALFACRPPEYKSLRQSPPIVDVAVKIKIVADAGALEREFAVALRAHLARLVTVVPEGTTAPLDAMLLSIEIDRINRTNVSPVAVGVAAGAAAGAMSAASSGVRGGGGLISVFEGLFWGLAVASDVEASQRHKSIMLGYVPPKIKGLITLGNHSSPKPAYVETISSKSVINEMRPLRESERYDISYLNDELARAFASAVASKLQRKFGWPANSTLSWYEPPLASCS